MNFTSLLDLATSAGIPWLPVADAVAKASLLLGAAGWRRCALRRASASARHLVWTLALVGVAGRAALSMALPQWRVAVVTIPAALDQPPAGSRRAADAPRQATRDAAAAPDRDRAGRRRSRPCTPAAPSRPTLSTCWTAWPGRPSPSGCGSRVPGDRRAAGRRADWRAVDVAPH